MRGIGLKSSGHKLPMFILWMTAITVPAILQVIFSGASIIRFVVFNQLNGPVAEPVLPVAEPRASCYPLGL